MKKYFTGLDTLRAIAALVVVWGHIELLKAEKGLVSERFYGIIHPSGHIAVVLFFVLSGFLITYLLYKEREKTGRIFLRGFYMKRLLRIWPLYYLVIALSYLLINAEYNLSTIILSLTIFPNVAYAAGIGWPSSPQIWSIGVEEQFYLFWPLLVRMLPRKWVIPSLILFFGAFAIFPHAFDFVNNRTIQNFALSDFITDFFVSSKFNSMAIGCLFGFMYATNHPFLKHLYKRWLAYTSLALSFLMWFLDFHIPFFTKEVFSIVFGIMILNLASNPDMKIKMEWKATKFLGRISYGIYMYHWIVILLVFKIIPERLYTHTIGLNMYIYVLVFGGTILVSWISFFTFEKFFLDLKHKYENRKRIKNAE